MTVITISSTAGDYDVSVLDIDFKSYLREGFKRFDYHADKHGVQTLRLEQNDGDYLSMVGSFSLKGLQARDRLKTVHQIDALVVGHDQQTTYTITDLNLASSDLKNDHSLAAFADAQTYKIVGNAHDNIIAGGLRNDVLYGNAGNDELYGGSGKDKLYGGDDNDKLDGGIQDDTLYGEGGNDKLLGGDGNDTLNGGTGTNTLIGGIGNDTYYIGAGDKIIEAKGKAGGQDTVISGINTDLGRFANVEDLQLTGNRDLKGFGNSGDNHIIGNDGDNTLAGKGGHDVLTGNGGSDHFIFSKGDGTVEITDFTFSGKDHDVLEFNGFGKVKFSDLDISKHGKNGIQIDIGQDHLIIDHVKINHIDAHDFQF